MKNYKYTLSGIDCAHCAKKIEKKISETSGYENVILNFSTSKLSFSTDKKENIKKEVIKLIKSVEPEVEIIDKKIDNTSRSELDILRLILGVGIYLIGSFFSDKISIIFTIISLIILLYKVAKKALIQIIKNKIIDENALITISSIGACIVNKQIEGIMVILLYEIGKTLEAKAVGKTRESISNLMNIKPEYANLKHNDDIIRVNPEEVKIGDIIVIKMGEKIPLDGEVINGTAEIDNSALTGESRLIKVEKGIKVLSGSINVQGIIEIKVEKTYENSTVNQILNLVENATDKKAKTETLVEKIAKIYTPVVMALAILVSIFMPIIFTEITYRESIYKALIFLVISCPCSIAISIPLTYFSSIGYASKNGILIKGSDYLDGLKDIETIVFDKTGTITTGNFIIKEINSFSEEYSKEEILELFAMGEKFSNHPIAKSILREINKEIDIKNVSDFKEITGKGIEYVYNNKKIKVGNESLVGSKSFEEGTVLYLKIEDKIIGNIILMDEIKKDAIETMKKLDELKIKKEMFTGDKSQVASFIANKVGIDIVKSEMLPTDKYNELEKILNNKNENKKVAYVGDGINDSPVLARADIGISMGGIGSNSAIEASDVVIMTDELKKIGEAISISKQTNKIIKFNLSFSMSVKLLILILSILGISNMWEAVFADVGTTLITIMTTLYLTGKNC